MYRQRAGSLVTLLKGPKELHYLKVLEWIKVRPEFEKYRKLIRKLSAESHTTASVYYAKSGDERAALRHALIAIGCAPRQRAYWRNLLSAGFHLVRRMAKSVRV
jgi:hypothetical protein